METRKSKSEVSDRGEKGVLLGPWFGPANEFGLNVAGPAQVNLYLDVKSKKKFLI